MIALCVGESLLEISGKSNVELKDGLNINLNEKVENGGGNAGNVAYLLAKWGVETHIASMMGADDFADVIKKEYESIGVKTDYLETTYDKQTNMKLIIVNDNTKKTTTIKIGDNLNLKKASFLDNNDVIFLDGTDLSASTSCIDKNPNARKFLLVTEVNNNTQELCRYVNHIIITQNAAELMTGMLMDLNNPNTLVNIYNRLKQKFEKTEILIFLNNNNVLYSYNNQIKIMPPLNTNIINSYGIETVFCGAYIYGIGREFGMEKSIAYGMIVASLRLNKLSLREGIPAISEVSSVFDSKYGTNNSRNNTGINPNVNE